MSSSLSSRPRARRTPTRHRPSVLDQVQVIADTTEDLPGFDRLGVPAWLVDALGRRGIAAPFPVQAATVPAALTGRDVLGRAATGAGKTLAFGIPLLAHLDGGSRTPRRPRGLVLVPTRELAAQVADALRPLGERRGLRTQVVVGGVGLGPQTASLARGVDVLVATPGRLEDLLARGAADLGAVEVTVIDEADHMADLGFLPAVRRLLDRVPAGGQRLLFSATLDGDVEVLVERYLTRPAVFSLGSAAPAVATMTHHLWRTTRDDKVGLVGAIAARGGRTLMFVRTKHGADRLARKLAQAGRPAGVLHGNRSQGQRTRALDAFRDGTVPLLVATDVAARGIHVDDVSLVVHVDPPTTGKDYVHRSGRTARAGHDGVVVMLATPDDAADARTVLREAGVQPAERAVRSTDDVVRAVTGASVSATPVTAAPVTARSVPARPVTARPVTATRVAGRPERPTVAPARRGRRGASRPAASPAGR